MDSPAVCILLATYNGERYLSELLASLAAQTHTRWTLLVRDDGSRDATLAIVDAAARRDPRIVRAVDALGNLGSSANFGQLLSIAEGDYFMLADQDDVWLPDKIAATLAVLRAAEATAPDGTPVLAFTDLSVTDAALGILDRSHMHRHGFHRTIQRGLGVRTLLTQNYAPGCTMMLNRALRSVALPFPADAAIHDWWLMVSAAAAGRLAYLDRPTLLYRQHGGNQIGSVGWRQRAREFRRRGFAPYRARLRDGCRQAGAVAERFRAQLSEHDLAACLLFRDLGRHPVPLRQLEAFRLGLSKTGWLRNLAFYALM